jgi:hypothetical protein
MSKTAKIKAGQLHAALDLRKWSSGTRHHGSETGDVCRETRTSAMGAEESVIPKV